MNEQEARWLADNLWSGVTGGQADKIRNMLGIRPTVGVQDLMEAVRDLELTPEVIEAVHKAQVDYNGATSSPEDSSTLPNKLVFRGRTFKVHAEDDATVHEWRLQLNPRCLICLRMDRHATPLWDWYIDYPSGNSTHSCVSDLSWPTAQDALVDLWQFAGCVGLSLPEPEPPPETPLTIWEHLDEDV